jgi:protein gp37
MAQLSSIEWTHATWNPVVGCRMVSSGCAHCSAERMAKRLAAMARATQDRGANPGRTANYLNVVNERGKWNGRVFLDYSALEDPVGWRRPRTIFVNSMSDLFYEKIPFDFVKRVFDVMNRCPQHTFQVLTKRPAVAADLSPRLIWGPNIWMGTSVENASVLDRVAFLRRTGAKIKFLSVEPLLGPIPRLPLTGIDWVIVGGESGPGARPMRPEWVRQIRDRCVGLGVAFFFKQWGGVNKSRIGRRVDSCCWDEYPDQTAPTRHDSAEVSGKTPSTVTEIRLAMSRADSPKSRCGPIENQDVLAYKNTLAWLMSVAPQSTRSDSRRFEQNTSFGSK